MSPREAQNFEGSFAAAGVRPPPDEPVNAMGFRV